jgi:hypothetical protein
MLMAEVLEASRVPEHVPADLVVDDFDLYNLPLTNEADPQTAYIAFRDRGEIFWSPRNGGHWVLTRAEDIKAIQNEIGRAHV